MNKYQYYTDGKEKVRKVIESCETREQLFGARKYLRLFERVVNEMFSREDELLSTMWVDLMVLGDHIDRKRIKLRDYKS